MRRSHLTGSLLAVIAVVATAWWLRHDVPRTTTSNAPKHEPAPEIAAAVTAAEAPAADQIPNTNIELSPPPGPEPTATDANRPFRVDAAGKLVLDEQTRLNMEALFAQTDPADLPAARQKITQALPPAAASQATILLERYDNYSQSQRQAYPPGVAPATEEAALAELEGLHALRVAHFGMEAAQALYGHEEVLTRSLIDLMRLEKDQSLTMEEKAARAQQLYDERSELSRADPSTLSIAKPPGQ